MRCLRFAVIAVLLGIALSFSVIAQTPGPVIPGSGPKITWTIPQWNTFFASLGNKIDKSNGVATNLTVNGGTATLASLTVGGLPITGGSGSAVGYKDITTTTYTTLSTDEILAINSAAPVAITLIAAPTVGTTQTVSDIAGLAGSANITVTPGSGTVSGYTNVILTQAYMSLDFTYTSNGWIIR